MNEYKMKYLVMKKRDDYHDVYNKKGDNLGIIWFNKKWKKYV